MVPYVPGQKNDGIRVPRSSPEVFTGLDVFLDNADIWVPYLVRHTHEVIFCIERKFYIL